MKKTINILALIFTNFIYIHGSTTISQAFKQAKGQDFFLALENYPSKGQPSGALHVADGKYNGDYYFMLNKKYQTPIFGASAAFQEIGKGIEEYGDSVFGGPPKGGCHWYNPNSWGNPWCQTS